MDGKTGKRCGKLPIIENKLLYDNKNYIELDSYIKNRTVVGIGAPGIIRTTH
jgi:hypothetical protein